MQLRQITKYICDFCHASFDCEDECLEHENRCPVGDRRIPSLGDYAVFQSIDKAGVHKAIRIGLIVNEKDQRTHFIGKKLFPDLSIDEHGDECKFSADALVKWYRGEEFDKLRGRAFCAFHYDDGAWTETSPPHFDIFEDAVEVKAIFKATPFWPIDRRNRA